MIRLQHLLCILFLGSTLALGCPPSNDDDDDTAMPDDDSSAGDDDTTAGDDDTTAGDDDTGDDDTGDDDSAMPDDDTGDDDTGPSDDSIYDVQQGNFADGDEVSLENVVITSPMSESPPGFFVQEPGSESNPEYSGIYVYIVDEQAAIDLAGIVAVGGAVDIQGTYTEYYDLSEISIDQVTDVVVVGTDMVNPVNVDACDVATGGSVQEAYEGVLVRVTNADVTDDNPDDPNDFGEFEVAGCLRVDDLFHVADGGLGDHFASITGPLYFAYDDAKIEPRDAADVIQ